MIARVFSLSPTRKLRLIALTLVAAFPLCGGAQITVRFSTNGATVAIPDKAFQAERVTQTSQHLADGSAITHEVHETLARDAAGRFYVESHTIQTKKQTDAGAKPPVVSYIVVDPVAKRMLQWSTASTVARVRTLTGAEHIGVDALVPPRPATVPPKTAVTEKKEELGSRTIAGVNATGIRTTTTIAAGAVGNDEELHTTHEVWTSDELQLAVEESEESPLTGTRTVKIASLQRTAPVASLFAVPDNYTLEKAADLNLGAMAASMKAFTDPGYLAAMKGLKNADTREKSADDLVAFAALHEEVGNDIAYNMALAHTHLDDAERLSSAAVERAEKTTSKIDMDHVTTATLGQMTGLASLWDTFAQVRYEKGDLETASKYERAAWEVSGKGFFLVRLASFEREKGHPEEAKNLLLLAMSGKMTDGDTKDANKALAELGVSEPKAVPETAIAVEDADGLEGSSDYYLEFVKQRPPVVHWLSGDSRMTVLEAAVSRASFPAQVPDDGPERVIRRGHLECAAKACKLTLLFTPDAVAQLPKPGGAR